VQTLCQPQVCPQNAEYRLYPGLGNDTILKYSGISEEYILPLSSGLYSQNLGSMFLSNVSVITQNTKILILTTIKTSNMRCDDTIFVHIRIGALILC
jgi:hypothetical protein